MEETNRVNTLNHASYFNPANSGRVDVIGCGAIGSRLVMELARLGLQDIHIWDDDVVSDHNISNQAFGIGHIGVKKVEALAAMVKEYTGLVVTQHDQRVVGAQGAELGRWVFLVIDSMEGRLDIWENGICCGLDTEFIIEARMGAVSGRVFAISRSNTEAVEYWTDTMRATLEGGRITSGCGTVVNIGATAGTMAMTATNQFIRMTKFIGSDGDAPEWDVTIGLDPHTVVTFPEYVAPLPDDYIVQ